MTRPTSKVATLFLRGGLVLLVVLAFRFVGHATGAALNPRDIVVADADAFGGSGGVIRIDPNTGAQTAISSGGLFVDPGGVAIAANGDIFVTDTNAFGGPGGVIRVNAATGSQTAVSSGGLFVSPVGIVIAGNGDLFVVDADAFGYGGIIRVNPATGAQTTVASGGYFWTPAGIALATDGTLLVADLNALGASPGGAVIRVNPATGAQTLVSSGGSFFDPNGVALDAAGQILVADHNSFVGGADGIGGGVGAIFRINPSTGAQTVVSTAGSFKAPGSVAVEGDGNILALDFGFCSPSRLPILFRVNPGSGAQTALSSGGLFACTRGIAIVPDVQPTLTSVSVTPTNPTINVSQTQQFTATGTFSNGNTRLLTSGGGAWVTKAPMPTPRAGMATATLNGALYTVGPSVMEAYDPVTNTWSARAPLPSTTWYAGAAGIGSKVYVVGGCGPAADCRIGTTNLLQVYDSSTNTWTTNPPMPTARSQMVVGAIGGKLYVVGGIGPCPPCISLAVLEVYDPATNAWTVKSPMPTPRSHMGGAVINGKLFVAGGLVRRVAADPQLPTATLEVYDPATDTWTTKAPLPAPGHGQGAGALNGWLYVIDSATGGNTFAAYDPLIDVWTMVAPILTPRYNPVPQTIDGILYVAGNGAGNVAISTLEAYTPADNLIWSSGNTSVAAISTTGLATAGSTAGSSTITATSRGVSGNTVLTVVSPDTIAPTTLASVSPAPNGAGWNKTNVTVTLTATDNPGGSGVQTLFYASTLNGSTVGGSVAASTTSLLIAAEGTTTVTYHARDVVGNNEPDRTIVVRLDKTPPALGAPSDMTVNATSPAGAVVTFTPTATDATSGVAPISSSPASGTTFPIGTTTVTVTASDTAGNTGTASFTVTVVRALSSIAVAPANPTINTGQTQQFTATGTFSDGSTSVLTAGTGAPQLLSATYFGGTGDQQGTGVAIAGGALYLSGNTSANGTDGIAARYALPLWSGATPTWSTTWPGVGDGDQFGGVALTSEGVYLAGNSYSQTTDGVGGKETKAVLAKFPLSGAATPTFVAKPHFFSYTGVEALFAATSVVEGGTPFVYAAGGGQPCSYFAFFVAKFDTLGTLIAKATESTAGIGFNTCVGGYDKSSSGDALTVLNGNVYVAGGSSYPDSIGKPVIWKHDANLILTWRQRKTTAGNFRGITAFGNALFVVGYVSTPSTPNTEDYLIEKYDEAGTLLWSKTSGGSASDVLTGVVAVGSRLFAVGYTRSQGSGGADAVILEIDPATGNTLSTTLFGGSQDEIASAVATDGTDLYVGGETRSFGGGGNDAMVLRFALSSSGVIWSSANPAVGTINTAALATGVSPGNTTITATSGSVTGSTILTVAKANQTITFGALSSRTFGDPDFAVSASASSGLAVSFTAADGCTVTGTTVRLTGAGSCTITAAQGGNANYNSATSVAQTFAIAKASQTITFGALAAKMYGDADFTVSGTASSGLATTFTATGSCTIAGATVHLTGAGSCTITAAQGEDANYSAATPVVRTFNTAAAPLTVTANNNSRAYGAANPTFTATYVGFVLGQSPTALGGTLTFSTAATAGSNAGPYAITPSGLTSTNYAITFVNGTLTVTATPLTVTADNKARSYGAANPSFTASYSGFVNGEGTGVLAGTVTFSTPATLASPVGTYAITPGGLTSSNYAISLVNGGLIVTRAPLLVKADDIARPYGAANPLFTASYSGFVLGEGSSVLGGVLTLTTPATPASEVGTYPIAPAGLVSVNYAITFVNGTLSVDTALSTVSGGWTVTIVKSTTSGVRASISGTGTVAKIAACIGNYKEVRLDQAFEMADITCSNTGTITVRAVRASRVIEVLKRYPVGSHFHWTRTTLSTRQTVTTGSPIAADPANTEAIPVDLLDENETSLGSFQLDPGESVDVEFTNGPNGGTLVALQVLVGTATFQGTTLTAGQPVQTFLLEPRALTQTVLDELIALRAGVADKQDGNKLDEAIKHLTKALDPALWVSLIRLQPKGGATVFNEEKDAVTKLRDLLKNKKSTIADVTLQSMITRLVAANRQLASVAIDDAVAARGKQNAIDKAIEERAKGDQDIAGQKLESAIEHYRNAWTHALASSD